MQSQTKIFHSMDEAQHSILSAILHHGEEISPRGMKTLEIRADAFTLSNPRNRCILSPPRRWNMALAIGELCWHLSAAKEVEALAYYAPSWRNFADEMGIVRGSCYGRKGFGDVGGRSPWKLASNLLASDPATRRAVIYFSDPQSHLEPFCKDAACASSLQFMIRGRRLEAFVSMRSNDAIWGLPYDVFLFTFLQEMMAQELNIDIGPYHHYASSLHIYERHYALARSIVDSPSAEAFPMPPMADLIELKHFLESEREVRESGSSESQEQLSPYWKELIKVLLIYHSAKSKGWRNIEIQEVNASAYSEVLSPLMHA